MIGLRTNPGLLLLSSPIIAILLAQPRAKNTPVQLERTKAGLAIARGAGRIGGQRRLMTEGKIKAGKQLLETGMSPRDVAENLGVSIASIYRYLPASSR